MLSEDKIARALKDTLRSPNEADSNGEIANVVDGLFAMSRAVARLGIMESDTSKGAIEGHTFEMRIVGEGIANSLDGVAAALRDIAAALREARHG